MAHGTISDSADIAPKQTSSDNSVDFSNNIDSDLSDHEKSISTQQSFENTKSVLNADIINVGNSNPNKEIHSDDLKKDIVEQVKKELLDIYAKTQQEENEFKVLEAREESIDEKLKKMIQEVKANKNSIEEDIRKIRNDVKGLQKQSGLHSHLSQDAKTQQEEKEFKVLEAPKESIDEDIKKITQEVEANKNSIEEDIRKIRNDMKGLPKQSGFKRQPAEDEFEQDVFSMMMLSHDWKGKDWRHVWLYGFFSFVIQIVLGVLVIMSQIEDEFAKTPLSIPIKETIPLYITKAQVLY